MRQAIAVFIAVSAALLGPAHAARKPLPSEQLAAGSYAARAADGAEIASRWCDSCHMVRQGSGKDVAPPFSVIASRRTPGQIRAFLARPHGNMPPIDLSNEQIEDIIAYMKSLNPGSDTAPDR